MKDRLRWGIIGTGHIAEEFADGIKESETGTLLAVAGRTDLSAERFASRIGVPCRYAGYQAMLDDPQVQAVYIATPHPVHAEWAIKAAEAGKHVLVEKPIGMNLAEASAMIEAAREHNVFLMEAFMYRCHPQTARLWELIAEGVIGEVRLIRASFGYFSLAGPDNRAFAQELGGGGILDVGCYPASLSRLVAGAATGAAFAEPVSLQAVAHKGETGVDEWSVAAVEFSGGIVAHLTCGVRIDMSGLNTVDVVGTAGRIHVPDPWVPSRWNREPTRILVWQDATQEPRVELVDAPRDLYTYEADTVARNLSLRQATAMSWADTLGNMRMLDQWRASIGLVYDSEKAAAAVHTITHRPLAVRADRRIPSGRLEGIDRPIARLIMGAAWNNAMPDTTILFDDYFEHGGTTFDTSSGYGSPPGTAERLLGAWIRHRGIRNDVVVIEKGANHPNDSPEGLTRELITGLDRLQMDYVDVYMIHRDNESVPIGEWVEVLNENLAAGRMKVFGLSNFTVERLTAFQAYADRHGLRSYTAVSNHFSLAQMLAPLWDCHLVSSTDDISRRWFERTRTPLLAWSSQARGFFTSRASRRAQSDPELVRCWYDEENFRRKDRAEVVAKRLGVDPTCVAVAYVLHQPFPTFALIGPLTVTELRSSMRAIDVELSDAEVAWLRDGGPVPDPGIRSVDSVG